MINKYKLKQLFVVNDNGRYRIFDATEFSNKNILTPLSTLFVARNEEERKQFNSTTFTLQQIIDLKRKINAIDKANLFVAEISFDGKKIPMLVEVINENGEIKYNRPLFDIEIGYEAQNVIVPLENLFDIKSNKIDPIQLMFLNYKISSEDFKEKFDKLSNMLKEEQHRIDEAQKSVKRAKEQMDQVMCHSFEKYAL